MKQAFGVCFQGNKKQIQTWCEERMNVNVFPSVRLL